MRLELTAFYRKILSEVSSLVICHSAIIYLYQEATHELLAVAAWSHEQALLHQNDELAIAANKAADVQRIRLSDSNTLPAWAANQRHLFLRSSAPDTSDASTTDIAELAAPFFSKKKFYGVLMLKRAQAWHSREVKLVRSLTNIMTISMENMEQIQQVHSNQVQRANFLSTITHELRSPLNTINGYLDLLLEGISGDLNAQQHSFAQRARAGSEHLYALLEDLLMISRADSGQLRLNCEIISLPEVIARAVEELDLTASDQGTTIVVDVPRNFPQLYADNVRLQQVLRNLMSNALHFTPDGGKVTISAWLERREQQKAADEVERLMKLQVRDTGAGIDPAFHERIFERFFQVPNASPTRAGGQGLGLAIVKMIVELHGGSIEVASVPAQGSTFTCTLPCLLSGG